MERILVNIYIPALNQDYDVFVPKGALFYEVRELAAKALADITDGKFIPNETTVLCLRENGEVLSINKTVYELGLKNGSKLMFI